MARKVKIFTTPYCTYCKAAKTFFEKNNVRYTEVDVSEDDKALKEMVEKSGQMAVPVILVDSEVVVGFNKAKLRRLLKLS